MKKNKSAQQNATLETGMEAVYLTACALRGQCPEWDSAKNLAALRKFCDFHSITAMVSMALEEYWRGNPAEDPELMRSWKQSKDRVVRRNVLLNAERERILSHLESIGCWYMPLKGSLIQFDYPKFGMRQMSDNDILYDKSMQRAVYDFLCASGYDSVEYGQGAHDEYRKHPFYNIEMHNALFRNPHFPTLTEYYRDVKQRLIKDENNQYGYHFSDDDFYIYMVAHAYKHSISSGIGVRYLVDVHVYLQNHGENLNWPYMEAEMRKLGVWEYDCRCRNLARKLFGESAAASALTEEEMQLVDTFFRAGTHGNMQNRVDLALADIQQDGEGLGIRAKIHYIFKRMFPSMDILTALYPELKGKKWKLPFVAAKRFVKAVFRQPKKTIKEITALFRAKSSDD